MKPWQLKQDSINMKQYYEKKDIWLETAQLQESVYINALRWTLIQAFLGQTESFQLIVKLKKKVKHIYIFLICKYKNK